MPPKRKRTEPAAGAPAKPTRTSTRSSKKNGPEGSAPSAPPRADASDDEDGGMVPPPNKASKTGSSSRSKSQKGKVTRNSRGKKLQIDGDDDEPAGPKSTVQNGAQDAAKSESYTQQRAVALFSQFADADIPDVIGAEGFERLCNEAQVPLDGAMPLLLAWQLDSHEMGKISKEEWMKGTDALRVASLSVLANILEDLNNLVVLGQPPAQAAKTQKGSSYDRARYGSYAADSRKAFLSFYSFCFALAKPESSRNIDMETACALWSVVLAPQFPLIADVIEFINANGSYKGVNKDLWSMMLEFCRDTQPDLSDFEADGAWPSIIDDFVTWKRAQADNEPVEAAADGA